MSNNLLFASVDLPLIDKTQSIKEILPLIEKYGFWDPYRHISMIPLLTKTGKTGIETVSNRFKEIGRAHV